MNSRTSSSTRHVLAVVAAGIFLGATSAARADSNAGGGLIAAYGNSVALYGAELHWSAPGLFGHLSDSSHLQTRWMADLAYWHGRERPTEHPSLVEGGLTPLVRWTTAAVGDLRGFVEAGVGMHLLSHHQINNDRDLGGSLQFGEQAGTGIAFGEGGRYELGAYVQHISNARTHRPNDGNTFLGAMFRARLR